jgi:small subunit ribosomal protein S13
MIVRIAGVVLPRKKKIGIGLTYIFGIGQRRATDLLSEAKISPETFCDELTQDEIVTLRKIIKTKYQTEGDLRRLKGYNIKRLKDIGSAAGRRHRVRLPVRGQRTRTNAQTRKRRLSK